jgi:hypothetical protein
MADYVSKFTIYTSDKICRIRFIDETENPPNETVIGEITTNKASLQGLADAINRLLKKPPQSVNPKEQTPQPRQQ